jgi:hypothetical protein
MLSLILPRVTQTIITFLYTISSTFEICNLLLKLPWQGAVSCHPVSSLLLVLFFCCKRFEWRQVSKKSKTIWGINYCCQTKPPISFSTIKYSDYNAQTEMMSTYQLTHNIRYTLQITRIKVKEIICININKMSTKCFVTYTSRFEGERGTLPKMFQKNEYIFVFPWEQKASLRNRCMLDNPSIYWLIGIID